MLLLVSSGRLSGREFFKLFADYWPVVLIIWGGIKLVEYAQAKRDGVPAPGIGGGGVVLLVFLILFGTMISAARRGMERVNWDTVRNNMDIDDEDFNNMFGGNKYQFDETIEKDFPANASLKVAVDRGDVQVTASSDNKVHIIVKKSLYADNEPAAKQSSDAFTPNVTIADNVVNVDALPRGDWKGRVDMQISVPRKAAVDLMTMRGALQVTGRDGQVKLNDSNGDITAEDVANNVTAHVSGNFTSKNVKGDVSLDGKGEDVNVSDTGGKFTLQGEYSAIVLNKIDKGVRFSSIRTEMELGKLDGELHMSNGELRANGLTAFRVTTRSKDIDLEDVSGDVKIENSNGQVQVTPKTPLANIDVTNRSGEVNLMLPSSGGFTIDASSLRGEIDSDFDLSATTDQNREQHLSGTVNKGGPHIQVRDDHGTIHIRKR